jgi:predicted ABC-type ATPase
MEQKNIEAIPKVIIFYGANGSGKSTISNSIIENPNLFKGEYINADLIAKSLEQKIPDYTTRNIEAANIAENRRITAIKEHRSLAFETVGSTPEKIALMTQAKESGYEVTLIFVTTKDPEINVQRVANRVAEGGHSVDPSAIRSRYEKTMQLLSVAVDHADNANIFDNSGRSPFLVAVKENMQLSLHNPAQHPDWVNKRLVTPYIERMESREAMSEILKNSNVSDAKISDANASNGSKYLGEIVTVTKHHVLQKLNNGDYLIHDLSLTATNNIKEGVHSKIEYAYEKGKIAPIIDSFNKVHIGSKMTEPEYKSVETKLGIKNAVITLPQANTTYSGNVMQVSETHIVQRTGNNSAVAHSIEKLSNGKELLSLAASGELKGKSFDFVYRTEQGKATQSLVQAVKNNVAPVIASAPNKQQNTEIKR